MIVKGNHKTLEKKLRFFFSGSCLFGAEFERATQQNREHGRLETRSILTSSDLPKDYTGFPDVAQAFCLTRKAIVIKTGEIREETVHGFTDLTSTQASPSDMLTLVRGHWHIENKSHYVRDVTFDEDHSRVRCGNLPQLMASLRNVCIALMRVAMCRNIAATCREFAAKPRKALSLLGVARTE
jgi:predicted transposase YbfD/YdcC